MKLTSKTGLTASPTKKIPKFTKPKNVSQLRAVAKPAPYVLKPYSGLYNPYSTGCSLLCNHPMDKEAKELFRRAKENWTSEGRRNILHAEEIALIKANLKTPRPHVLSQVESVPEELFRRYTETDSRPLTPAPTLASAATRASGSRRCVTPEACTRHPKAQLVLDLRRTHSQETISYSASLHEPPLIRIQHVPTRAASLEEIPQHSNNVGSNHSLPIQSPRKAKTAINNSSKINLTVIKTEKQEDQVSGDNNANLNEEEEDFIKRRGKKKKKKERDASRGPPAFQASLDPETQVAAIGTDSANHSARTSLVPNNTSQDALEESSKNYINKNTNNKLIRSHKSLEIDSYLDTEILKQLRRELNEEIVDNELNLKRRKALQEALKAISKDKSDCEELIKLQNELKVPSLNADLWITLPRNFTRSSARFELPMDSRSLSTMTPIAYIRDHVSVSSERKLLFNCIFNKFKMEADLENEHERKLSGKALQDALDLLMGRPMKTEEAFKFRNLVGWNSDDVIDFRTFCGIAALCERIMAPFYCRRLADRKSDPCHEIEIADFEVLDRKISGKIIDERLIQILNDIKTL
ncbi:unnamed protein product [Ceutorhynchus assimilis]|uniref:Uncharacterized protein n=1 Tax=Ceutorhynchus assimilis TaxID=467358 RepID=A0A9N9MRN3_9CUCU|nr:unnamed protein product [Ceutorhynchus assimilis]